MNRLVIALIAAGAAIAAGVVAAAGGWWTPWANRYIQGVDVSHHQGAIDWPTLADDNVATVALLPEGSRAANPAFDVTPARLVTGLITERGVCAATADGLRTLFPEHAHAAIP